MKVRRVNGAALPTKFGDFNIYGFESEAGSESVVALVMGDPAAQASPLVRIHSQCLTGESFGSYRCDCGSQLDVAMSTIADEGHGVLIYQFDEGRGIGLLNKLSAYALQDRGHDTVEANHQLGFEADPRSYAFCSAVLGDLGIRGLRLMSNNPRKLKALEDSGIGPIERVPIEIPASRNSAGYLRTKKAKLGHLLSGV